MLYQLLKSKRFIFLLLCLCWWSASDAHAQQRSTSRSSTRSSGSSRSGGGSQGGYDNTSIGEAMISSDPETRRIIVITDDATAEHISQVITNLDKPKPQVLIKVVFLEVTYKNSLDVGLEGSYAKKTGNSTTGLVNNVFGLAAQGASGTSPGGLYQLLGSDYTVTLRALAEAGKLEVLSRPSILARNNQQASITVGQSVPVPASSQIGANGQISTQVQYRDVGIILRVTPFITSDGLVEMIVAPEISTLTAQTVAINETLRAPVIATRYAETVVVTPHGQTIVIGGLMENNKTSTDRKIPLLGDIPLLGALFKRKITEDTKTELVIFLTPYVVANPGQLAEMTRRETEKSELKKGSFSEKELNRFIDALPVKDNPMPGPAPLPDSPKAGKSKPTSPRSR